MNSIQLKSHHIGSDGRLQVDLPDLHDTDIDVIQRRQQQANRDRSKV